MGNQMFALENMAKKLGLKLPVFDEDVIVAALIRYLEATGDDPQTKASVVKTLLQSLTYESGSNGSPESAAVSNRSINVVAEPKRIQPRAQPARAAAFRLHVPKEETRRVTKSTTTQTETRPDPTVNNGIGVATRSGQHHGSRVDFGGTRIGTPIYDLGGTPPPKARSVKDDAAEMIKKSQPEHGTRLSNGVVIKD